MVVSQRILPVKLGLINSAWLGTPVTTERGIALTKEIGFDCIDIFADPLEIDAAERRLIRKTTAKNQLPVDLHRLLRARHRGFQQTGARFPRASRKKLSRSLL